MTRKIWIAKRSRSIYYRSLRCCQGVRWQLLSNFLLSGNPLLGFVMVTVMSCHVMPAGWLFIKMQCNYVDSYSVAYHGTAVYSAAPVANIETRRRRRLEQGPGHMPQMHCSLYAYWGTLVLSSCFRRSHCRRQSVSLSVHPKRPVAAKGGTVWVRIMRHLGIFYMPQIYDMGQTALLPLRRKACWEFFCP
jgi:hypothetical protein